MSEVASGCACAREVCCVMPEPLKNMLSHPEVELLADGLEKAHPQFDRTSFVAVSDRLQALELKDRINAIADQLAASLPDDYPTALGMVVDVSASVSGFVAWPLCSFVERHGSEHPDESLAAIETLTQVMSCEFAIRPFLDRYLDEAMEAVRSWAVHDIDTVRRLASEGTRPLLPWGPRVAALTADPTLGLEVLELLRYDPSEDVRRSVANHLNDVAKAHPDLVVETVKRWSEDDQVDPAMIRHALRTLIKQGNPSAMEVLGFTTEAKVTVENLSVSPASISLGDSIEMRATLVSESDVVQKLVIDFVIHHPTAQGKVSTKVFKWTTVDLDPGQRIDLRKSRKIATASTRKYTAGVHVVELLVAGQVAAETSFDLRDSSS